MTSLKKIGEIVNIRADEIKLNPNQPRRYFEPKEINALAQSIAGCGILQPLTVKECGGGYELVCGERRLRASKIAGLTYVPCVVVEITEANSAVMSLIENVQRKKLDFFEQADAVSRLIKNYHISPENLAFHLGMPQENILRKLKLAGFDAEERQLIMSYGLSERYAAEFLKIKSKRQRTEIIKLVGEKFLDIEQAENLVEKEINEQKIMKSFQKRAGIFKDIKLFINTINKAVRVMRMAGINCNLERQTSEESIKFIVTVPIDKN